MSTVRRFPHCSHWGVAVWLYPSPGREEPRSLMATPNPHEKESMT
jgi:hypothetical protein